MEKTSDIVRTNLLKVKTKTVENKNKNNIRIFKGYEFIEYKFFFKS